MPRLLLIDNYDSFTFNLAQGLAVAGAAVEVVRNDAFSVAEILARRAEFSGLVLSPGPGRPEDAGVCPALLDALRERAADLPLLGVCLGHQLIGQALGATVRRAAAPIHGKVWPIVLTASAAADPLWAELPRELAVTRYHSLVVAEATLPAALLATARTLDGASEQGPGQGELMALRHVALPWWGLQFHPESIGSREGPRLLRNFVRCCEAATCSAR